MRADQIAKALPKLPVGSSWHIMFGEVDGKPKVRLTLLRGGVDVRHGTIDIEFYGYGGVIGLAHTVLDEQERKRL